MDQTPVAQMSAQRMATLIKNYQEVYTMRNRVQVMIIKETEEWNEFTLNNGPPGVPCQALHAEVIRRLYGLMGEIEVALDRLEHYLPGLKMMMREMHTRN